MMHAMTQIRTGHIRSFTLALSLATFAAFAAAPARADEDCSSPMAEWQSREAATAYAAGLGIKVERMRVDDGCYKLRGQDSDGNRVSLKLDPASFAVMGMEVRFRPGADPSRYLKGARGQTGPAPAAKPPQDNPLITPGTVPKATSN